MIFPLINLNVCGGQVITKEVTESLHRFLSQVYVTLGRTLGKTVKSFTHATSHFTTYCDIFAVQTALAIASQSWSSRNGLNGSRQRQVAFFFCMGNCCNPRRVLKPFVRLRTGFTSWKVLLCFGQGNYILVTDDAASAANFDGADKSSMC